jgi:dTDP-4-dehydrorhamnose reductase
MKKLLIIGHKGMLGSDLMEVFKASDNYSVTGWDRNEIDITDENQVMDKINSLNPDIVISSAAYTDVDGCETNEEIAMDVNGRAVGNLAKACKKNEVVMVHYSTDYIFKGVKKEGYAEDEADIEPLNVYGKSKALGEKELINNTDKYYLIRTSWLYGHNGKNFVDTMLKLSEDNDSLKVVSDQHGKPTYAKDLAENTRKIIEGNYSFGTYHITNEDETTWYDFAREIFKQSGIEIEVDPCDTDEFPKPAKRPKYSSLINNKMPKIRSWKDALKEYLRSE